MILPEHLDHHKKLVKLGVFKQPMLMLGNQEDHTGKAKELFGDYQTFDPDGGDFKLDLSGGVSQFYKSFSTVYNLGTIEHIWDCHTAYCNAARMIVLEGYFVGHSPVGGYEHHGIHVTDADFILEFFRINGFSIINYWFTTQSGIEIPVVRRGGGNTILWFAAKKLGEVKEFTKPQQRFNKGVPL